MPRIPSVTPDTTPDGSRALLEEVEHAFGTVPNIAKTLAHSPAALQAWVGLNGALGSTLTPELREQISIAVAEANGCAYCLSAHTAVGGMVGLDAQELSLAREGASSDLRRKAALEFALAVLESRGDVSDEALARVRAAGFDDGEIAELVAHVALNVLTNYFNHVARPEIDFPLVVPATKRYRGFAQVEYAYVREHVLPAFDWTTFAQPSPRHRLQRPLEQARVALVATAGAHLSDQPAFDLGKEGDSSYRELPADAGELRFSHGGYDTRRARADPDVVFPLALLRQLAIEGEIGELAPRAFSFMGYIPESEPLLQKTGPEVARKLLADAVDLVLLVPS